MVCEFRDDPPCIEEVKPNLTQTDVLKSAAQVPCLTSKALGCLQSSDNGFPIRLSFPSLLGSSSVAGVKVCFCSLVFLNNVPSIHKENGFEALTSVAQMPFFGGEGGARENLAVTWCQNNNHTTVLTVAEEIGSVPES